MEVNLTLEGLMKLIKGFPEEIEWILIIFKWYLESWRAFFCPLHGECSLSLLVNQFRGSWINSKLVDGKEIQKYYLRLMKYF